MNTKNVLITGVSSVGIAAAVIVCVLIVSHPGHGGFYPQGRSESYQQGHDAARDYYAVPTNQESFHYDVGNGYNAAIDCWMLMGFSGRHPASTEDWVSGCVDAMHELGLKP